MKYCHNFVDIKSDVKTNKKVKWIHLDQINLLTLQMVQEGRG